MKWITAIALSWCINSSIGFAWILFLAYRNGWILNMKLTPIPLCWIFLVISVASIPLGIMGLIHYNTLLYGKGKPSGGHRVPKVLPVVVKVNSNRRI